MRTEAPGKIVLSGAYAVLEGAPAIVAAVDRYVVADSERPGTFTTPEFEAAGTGRPQPYFDASALRDNDQKLGLGSSAAILVACLGALKLETRPDASPDELRRAIFPTALAAHRRAQAGGSGIDVAASTFGGYSIARRTSTGELEREQLAAPPGLFLSVWASGTPASTRDLVAQVLGLKEHDPARFSESMGAQSRAAAAAESAWRRGSAHDFIVALADQHRALEQLGHAARREIVVDAVRQLHAVAIRERAAVLPAGAGGGDVCLYAGLASPSAELREVAGRLGQKPLDLRLGVPGLAAAPHFPQPPLAKP